MGAPQPPTPPPTTQHPHTTKNRKNQLGFFTIRGYLQHIQRPETHPELVLAGLIPPVHNEPGEEGPEEAVVQGIRPVLQAAGVFQGHTPNTLHGT